MRCSHYDREYTNAAGERCKATATVRLLDPDGERVSGCIYCQAHAQAIIDEYREKLGEVWTTLPIGELANDLIGQPVKPEPRKPAKMSDLGPHVQKMLLGGLDCPAGTRDLFPTDGPPEQPAPPYTAADLVRDTLADLEETPPRG